MNKFTQQILIILWNDKIQISNFQQLFCVISGKERLPKGIQYSTIYNTSSNFSIWEIMCLVWDSNSEPLSLIINTLPIELSGPEQTWCWEVCRPDSCSKSIAITAKGSEFESQSQDTFLLRWNNYYSFQLIADPMNVFKLLK